MFHEAICQGLIVRFTPLEEVFPSQFVAVQSPNFPITLPLCASPPTCELWSPPLTRIVFLGHIAIWCSTSRLYNSTGAPPRSILVCILQSLSFRPQLLMFALVLSLLVHSFPSPQCFYSQDDGRSPRVDHHCFIFAYFQPYGAISLSPLFSVDNNTSHLFSFMCLRLVSNGCYCFVSVTDLAGSMLLSVSIRSFFCLFSSFFAFLISSPLNVVQIFLFSFHSCMEAQGWVNCPQSYHRQTFCFTVGVAAKNTGVGTIWALSIQFVFRGVEVWLALRPLLIFHERWWGLRQ